jgi:hypothetical protein
MPPDVRFFRPGISVVYLAPTIASLAAPTVAEVATAGVKIVGMANFEGFNYQSQFLEARDWDDNFVPKYPGDDQAADSALVLWEKRVTNALRTTLAKGVATNVVIFFSGIAGAAPAAADKCEVWPVVSAGPVRLYSRTELAQWRVGLGPTARPNVDAVMAA